MATKNRAVPPIPIRYTTCLRHTLHVLLALGTLLEASLARSQLVPGSMDVHWNGGSQDCKAVVQPPIQVHAYNPRTFILRENLCATFEAPFIYLLVGSTKALLIDSGDVADPKLMPLASTVMQLLPADGPAKDGPACRPYAPAP
jgi:hydroxyacylglutathione hydrolase